MKVTAENTADSQVILTFEAEPAELEQSMERAYKRLAQRASIPGFRRGKAPRVVLDRYLGREAVLEEAVNILIPEATDKALEERGINAIARPAVEVLGMEPAQWKATVPVRPTVELGAYQAIRIEPPKTEVTEEQVKAVLEELRFSRTPWQPADRPVQFGDLVTIDVAGMDGEKSVTDQKGAQYRPQQGGRWPVPGFAEQVVGLEKGQSKEFTLSYPADDPNKELAGKSIQFAVAVTDVKEKRLPDLTDEFAKGVGDGYESLAALKEEITHDLRARAEAAAQSEHQEKALQELVRGATVSYPPILVEHELEHLLNEQEERLRRNKISLTDFLKAVGKTSDQDREELREVARQRTVRSLVLARFIEAEQITATPEETSAEIEKLCQSAGGQADKLRELFSRPETRQSAERSLVQRKALERLAAIARGEAGQATQLWTPSSPAAGGLARTP